MITQVNSLILTNPLLVNNNDGYLHNKYRKRLQLAQKIKAEEE